MRAQMAAYLLFKALLAGCAGGPVRDLAERRAEAIEISTAEADALVTGPSGRARAAGAAGAAGVGAAAAVLMDGMSAGRTRALAGRLQAEAQPAAFIEDIAERVRQDVGPSAQASSGPRIQLVLAVSRLELQPKFPPFDGSVTLVGAQKRQCSSASA